MNFTDSVLIPQSLFILSLDITNNLVIGILAGGLQHRVKTEGGNSLRKKQSRSVMEVTKVLFNTDILKSRAIWFYLV